ncbi:MAG: hypothetical protein PHO54_02690, partial [Candidatus Peribacteraceae bacterium]|nr:hypothetical protein [Candidatus Peribacteraceae bacterium]
HNMDRETFHRKWYYRILHLIFWSSLVSLAGGLILLGLTEDDIPAAGFFWAGVVILVYWLARRTLYAILFGDPMFRRRHTR